MRPVLVVPTHTWPATLDTLIARAGMPVVVVHTVPKLGDRPGVTNVHDFGPVNIHRWWNRGMKEAERLGADVAVIANHDVIPADGDQLTMLASKVHTSGATLGVAGVEDRMTGWCFALNLSHGLRAPHDVFRWHWGDNWLWDQAGKYFHGRVVTGAVVTHAKDDTNGRRFPAAFAPLVRRDREKWREYVAQVPRPDVVYRVRPGDVNEELRFSLRSLVNVPHNRVWVVGHRPNWVKGVEHLPGNRHDVKWLNGYDNLRIAVEHSGISDPFLLVDDDNFVMRKVDAVPFMHRGTIADQLAVMNGVRSVWVRTLVNTAEALDNLGVVSPLSYEVHVPYLVHKAGMLSAFEVGDSWPGDKPLQIRSLDGNLNCRGGDLIGDVKAVSGKPVPAGGVFLSTSDATFPRARVLLSRRFPVRSPYER